MRFQSEKELKMKVIRFDQSNHTTIRMTQSELGTTPSAGNRAKFKPRLGLGLLRLKIQHVCSHWLPEIELSASRDNFSKLK